MGISTWLLSIVGVVLIGVVAEMIMPDGPTNKYIKGIFAIFTVFVIVLPLPHMSLESIDFGDFFGSGEVQVDNNFIENINAQKILEYELIIKSLLEENGYSGIDVEIDADIKSAQVTIKTIFVDLSLLVLRTQELNINKYDKITAIINSAVKIEREKILFYGG